MKVILKRNFFDGKQLFRCKPSQPIEMPDYLYGKLPDTAVVVEKPLTSSKASSKKEDAKEEETTPNGSRDFKRN